MCLFHLSYPPSINSIIFTVSSCYVDSLIRITLIVSGSLEESKQQLLLQLDMVSTKLVRIVSVDSITALRQVSEVPRLFRRTNRDVPTKCLPYVAAMLSPPSEFYTSHKSHPSTSHWLQSIFSNITRQ